MKVQKRIFQIIGGLLGTILGAIGASYVAPDTGILQVIFTIIGAAFGLIIGLVLGTEIYKTISNKSIN